MSCARLLMFFAIVGCGTSDEARLVPTESKPETSRVVPDPAAAKAQRKPMRVMRMSSHGFLRITENGVNREEALPESPLKHGEFPEGCWAAPDGAVYAVGKQYTGVPGPDFGVVWRRAPDGAWSTAFRLKDRTFHSITGRRADEIVVGALGGFVAFDGKTWTVRDLPEDSSVWNVWSDGTSLFVEDFAGTKTLAITGGTAKPIAHQPRDAHEDRYACARGETKYRVFEKSEERGEAELSPDEDAEIRDEIKAIEEHPERIRPTKE